MWLGCPHGKQNKVYDLHVEDKSGVAYPTHFSILSAYIYYKETHSQY